MEGPFFGKHLQKRYNLVLQTHLFRNCRNDQMAAVMLQVITNFQENYSKISLFISEITYEKNIVSKNYTVLTNSTMTKCVPYPIADITKD